MLTDNSRTAGRTTGLHNALCTVGRGITPLLKPSIAVYDGRIELHDIRQLRRTKTIHVIGQHRCGLCFYIAASQQRIQHAITVVRSACATLSTKQSVCRRI